MSDDLNHLRTEFQRVLAHRFPQVCWPSDDGGPCVTCGHAAADHWWSLDHAGCEVFHASQDTSHTQECRCTRYVAPVRLRWYSRVWSWLTRKRLPRAQVWR